LRGRRAAKKTLAAANRRTPAAPPPELADGSPRDREEGGDVAFSPFLILWLGRARPFGPGGGARRREPLFAAVGGTTSRSGGAMAGSGALRGGAPVFVRVGDRLLDDDTRDSSGQ
jgi:hypothetical protein